ncbi:MAG: Nif11-like leader peptide family natural product precursor [Pontiellaceae bacterium]|nr:Nif11-like leader peptide family natural product precursor [Pontiellaceae bacterium]MBN2785676.1 Nif11-like leader peptide family natural product precursor [Pontiellaceae bacterium]
MAKEEVERFLIAGGENYDFRLKYDTLEPKTAFVAEANKEGYDFTEAEFDAVLKESGDDFASYGNPRKRGIWWF